MVKISNLPVKQRHRSNSAISVRAHISEYCSTKHWRGLAAVTLSIKQGIRQHGHLFYANEDRCSQIFEYFMRRLNRAVYGKAARRSEKRLRVIPIIEKDKYGRWHIHAVIETPAGMNAKQFHQAILCYWAQSNPWAYRKNEAKTGNQGWIIYLFKLRQKSGLEAWSDCVDWHSFYNPMCG